MDFAREHIMPKKLISGLVFLTFFPSVAMGLPAGGRVAGGAANVNPPKGQTLNINQLTDRAIINWKGFNIDVNELVRFIQPSSKSIVLNRVTGVDPSSILGQLVANGRVFIVNSNGIFIGSKATVDVAGLLATTLNIKDADFMAGKFNFSQDPGKSAAYVINQGQIRVSDNGFVFLVAPGVSNEGLVIANLGKVVMGSGEKLTVDFMGDGLITFAVEGKVLNQVTGPDGAPLSSAVANIGTIKADGGQVILKAKASSEIFSSVVNNSGVIEARSLLNRGGIIRLEGSDPVANTGEIGWQNNLGKVQNAEGAVINTGRLDVSAAERGAAPGQVTLSGQMVGSSGTILARGAGGSQGGRVLITSTDKTVVTSDSQIDTSGVSNSSAGNVVVWSDKDTIYGGSILAKGGEVNGDGGWVEVSGHENLSFTGTVNTLAPNGTTGTLLLDPRDITVAAAGAATLMQVDEFSDTPGNDLTIASGTINSAPSNVILQANRDITVSNAINMVNAGLGITMQAGRDISVNAGISTNNGNISLTANDSTAIGANRTNATPGDITFTMAGANLSAGTGNINLTVDPSTANPFNPGSITNVRNLTTTGGNIAINSPNNVSLSGTVNSGSGTVTINANSDGAGAQSFTMNAGSSITTTNATANAVRISVNSAGTATGAATLRDITATGGTLTVATDIGGNTTGGAISQAAGTALNVGTAQLSTGNGAITLNNATNNFGTATVSRATNVTLRDTNALNFGTSTISGNLTATAGGAVTQSGALSSSGGASTLTVTTLNNAGAPITLNNAANNFVNVNLNARNAADTANAPGAIIYRDTNAVNATQIRTTSTVDLTAGGSITDSGALAGSTLTATTLNDAGAAITLDTATNDFATVNLRARNATNTADANGALSYRDANAFDVAAAETTNTVTLTGAGAITDSGTLTGSTLSATTLNNAGAPITLDSATNNFANIDLSARNAANSANAPGALTYRDTDAINVNQIRTTSTAGLTAGGAITQTGAITAAGLQVTTSGPVTLNNAANAISTLAASVTGAGDALSFTNGGALSVGTVNGVSGVSTTNASITLTANAGGLTVTNTPALVDVNAGTGPVTLNANGANQVLTASAGTSVTGNGGATLLADDMILNGTLTATGQSVNLRQSTNGRLIALGTNVAGQLGLTDAELDGITAANLRIGNNNSGNISNTAAISPAGSTTLTLETAGTVTQTVAGSITIPTLDITTRNNAGSSIALNNATNDATTISLRARNAANTADAAGSISYRDANGFDVAAAQTTSTLNLTAGGPITDSGSLIVGGATTLAAGTGNDITLNTTTNNFSTVAITSGSNVTLVDSDAVGLGASTISGGLNVMTGGPITQSGALTVGGTTTLAGGSGNDITLNSAGNDFSTLGIASGRNVTLVDSNPLDLGTSSVSGNLSLTTGGAVIQSGALSVAGTTSLTASAANTDILLNTEANNFAGALSFGGTLANFRDIGLRNTNPGATVPTLSGLTNLRNLTVSFDSAAVNLPTLTASGTLNVTTGGAITDSGNVVVTGATTLAAGAANDITLDSAGNNFSTVAVNSGNNVALTDANALTLGASTIAGTLNIVANGLISQSGALTVGSNASFDTTAAIALGSVSLTNGGALTMGTSTIGGALAIATTAGDLTLAAGQTLTAAGDANLTAAGSVNLLGAALIGGTQTFNGGTGSTFVLASDTNLNTLSLPSSGNITVSLTGTQATFAGAPILPSAVNLSNPGNNFGGTVSVTTASPAFTGNVTNTHNLAQTSPVSLNPGQELTVTDAGGTAGKRGNITLDNAGNNFNNVNFTGGDIAWQQANAISIGSASANLGTTSSGALTITANGPITQTGPVTAAGTTILSASGGNITLTHAANDFKTVSVFSGNDVTLVDANALDLAASAITGNLNVTTNGALIQSGPLTVAGMTTLAVGSGNDITLNNAANNFSSLAVTSGSNVSLADANALDLAASSISGNLNVTAGGAITDNGNLNVMGTTTLAAGISNDITLDNANNFSTVSITSGRNVTLNDINALDLGASIVSGTLNVTPNGDLTQSGALTVAGTTTLSAGPGNDITLADAGNNFSTVAVGSGRDVALTDANTLDLGASTISGILDVRTGGAVTQSGALHVARNATFAAGASNDINLSNASNDFSTVAITSGRNVTVQDSNAVNLGASTVSGTLNVTTDGSLTQSGALVVTGLTTLSAGAGDITIDNPANNFRSLTISSGNNVILVDSNALDLGDSTISGVLNVATSGPLTQSGPLTVAGATTLAAGAGNDITLSNPANNFSSVAVTSANNVTLADANALDLGTSNVSGNLNVTTGGAITDSGNIVVAGITTLAAGSSNDIALDSAGNNFSTVGVTSGRNLTLADVNALDLGASTVSGTLNVTTNGALTQSSALSVTGPTILSAGAAHDITLNNASNNFSTVAVNGANNVALADANALDLGSSIVSGTLNITTNGVLTQSGTLTVAGPITLAAGSGNDITLNNAGNDFSTVTVTNGNNVSLRDANNISLGTSTVAGNFSVAAGGAIVDGDETGINITANSTSLTAATNVGSAANPLETAVGTLNATSNAGGIYIAEADGLTVNSVVANGGNVTISNSTGDMVINAISATGGIDLLAAGGSIFDGNGTANNLTAVADSNLRALGGVIGLSTDPIEVNINPGLLEVAATGQIGGVSVHINGTVSPTNTLTLLNSPPGEVIFNSQSANPPPINLPNFIGIAAELNSYRVNENDYCTDLLLDVLSDDFFKAQSFQCEMDDSLREKRASDLCHNDDL
jgi:trimeric autotransporter adhesin